MLVIDFGGFTAKINDKIILNKEGESYGSSD